MKLPIIATIFTFIAVFLFMGADATACIYEKEDPAHSSLKNCVCKISYNGRSTAGGNIKIPLDCLKEAGEDCEAKTRGGQDFCDKFIDFIYSVTEPKHQCKSPDAYDLMYKLKNCPNFHKK